VTRHNAEMLAIDREFALSNNTVQVGDILFDHSYIVLVEQVRAYSGVTGPTCVYEGARLKKDLSPRKDGRRVSVWQQNIKSHLRDGKEVSTATRP